MTANSNIDVIIPALNEENAIGLVIEDIPSFVRNVIVVDNGSTDATAKIANEKGAIVLKEPQKGYGKACLTGIDYITKLVLQPDIVVFIDADYSDYPAQMQRLVEPITRNNIDFVLGSRVLGKKDAGSMMPQQIFGNWLSTGLIRLIYGVKYTDLGPFRAIKFEKLKMLRMKDQNFGWTVEMQIKAIKNKLTFIEIPVDYKIRIGESKVSGTIYGSIMAGYKILYTILKYL